MTDKNGQIMILMFEFFGITLYQVCLDIYPFKFVVKLTSFRSTCYMLFQFMKKSATVILIPSANLHVWEFDCKAIFPEVVRRTYDPGKLNMELFAILMSEF